MDLWHGGQGRRLGQVEPLGALLQRAAALEPPARQLVLEHLETDHLERRRAVVDA